MRNKRIAVFCGSAKGNDPVYAESAIELGKTFVTNNIGLVYGGGSIGLMGVIADEMMSSGGEVIGVIPQKLKDWEVGHEGITQLHVVDTMHERKAMMADLSLVFNQVSCDLLNLCSIPFDDGVLQFGHKLFVNLGKVVHKIERVLDFMCNACRKFTK